MFRRSRNSKLPEGSRELAAIMGPIEDPHIGTLNEGSLHSALKQVYARPGDEVEVPLDGFVIDLRRGDRLIEIQTGAFGAMARKLDRLLESHHITLVHPIAVETMLDRPDRSPRRSPKKGSIYDMFDELVSIPTLLDHPHLVLEIVLIAETKVQVPDPRARRGRGGYRTIDRELREIVETQRFESTADIARLIPDGLPKVFTTADLADRAGVARGVAQQIAYCFRHLEVFEVRRKTRAGYEYEIAAP